MKILVGPVAKGEHYFDRPELTRQLFQSLERHHHLVMAATRRVGKTSFMQHLLEVSGPYDFVYVITESINDPQEFFKKIYLALYALLGQTKKMSGFFNQKAKTLRIKKLGPTGIEFDRLELQYFEELKELIQAFSDESKPMVLLVDEFSQTVENIIKDQSNAVAGRFLHQCRELRLMQVGRCKLHFVLSGSIGLENLVSDLSESKSINDLGSFEIPPLSKAEASQFIRQILDNDAIHMSKVAEEHLFARLRWLVPYYIQIVFMEMEKILIAEKIQVIDAGVIDRAFQQALLVRNYFEHWYIRLRSVFHGKSFNVAKSILNQAARQQSISVFEIQDILLKNEMEEGRYVLNSLIHDGYLTRTEGQHYHFNSPLLQQWWADNIYI